MAAMWIKKLERAVGWVVLRGSLLVAAYLAYLILQEWVAQELQGGKK